MIFGYFTLFVALLIEAVGAYYSITGLAAIFSGAVVPILIMGGTLEIGKVTAAVWLKNNWHRASLQFKLYLLPAVVMLMIITSMGIFGFLSKAHNDQNLVSGDVQSKIAIYDEKIKIQKDNIESARRALQQMDAAVDQTMARSTNEQGADKAANLRRSQARERTNLQKEITTAQAEIVKLNDLRAPIAAEVRKVEAEVGPLKYIAKMIYGDNPDANLLEQAVVWVIIMIVAVFDPLALVLILAAQQSIRWARGEEESKPTDPKQPNFLDKLKERFNKQQPETVVDLDQVNAELAEIAETDKQQSAESEAVVPPGSFFQSEPEVQIIEKVVEREVPVTDPEVQKELEATQQALAELAADFNKLQEQNNTSLERSLNLKIQNDDLLKQISKLNNPLSITERPGDYVDTTPPENIPTIEPIENSEYVRVDGKVLGKDSLSVMFPELVAQADNAHKKLAGSRADFGTEFPSAPRKGDLFLRVDSLPTRLYKWNGTKWLEIDKNTTDTYAYNERYIKHLVNQLEAGAYDADDLNDAERDQIEQYLKGRDAQ